MFFPLTAACMSARTTLIPLGETTDEEAISVVTRSGAQAIVTDRLLSLASGDEVAIGDQIRMSALSNVSSAAHFGESVVLKLSKGEGAEQSPRRSVMLTARRPQLLRIVLNASSYRLV